MAYEQTPTLNLNLYPQGKFAERCIGFVYELARWEEANQLEAVTHQTPSQSVPIFSIQRDTAYIVPDDMAMYARCQF